MASKKYNSKYHLIIIGVLIVLFVGILILSSANKNIVSKVTFEPEIIIDDTYGNVVLGKIELTNNGYLPSRFILPEYVACYYSEGQIISDYSDQVYYRKEAVNFETSVMDYSRRSVDVLAGDSLELELYTYKSLPLRSDTYIQGKLSELDELELRVYEVVPERDDFRYNYCNYATNDDLVKIINVKVEKNETK